MLALIKWALLGIMMVVITPPMYKMLLMYGVGVKFYNNYPGKCNVVPGVETGSEKIVTTEDGLAFVTSGVKEFRNLDRNTLTGKLYLFDLNNPEKGAIDLHIRSKTIKLEEFTPHGVDFLEIDGTSVKLFVVNHANGVESVEVFLYKRQQPTEIEHVKTIVDENFKCLNDITVVDEHTFYVTNLIKYCAVTNIHGILLEHLLALKTANIVRYRKGETRIVVEDLSGLNGLTASDTHVFSVSASTASLHVFERDDKADRLPLISTVDTVYNCDNVHLDKHTGHLYVATFKTFLRVFLATTNGATGIRITPNNKNWSAAGVTEVFHDNGQMLTGASVIVHWRQKYLIGSIDNRLVYCDDN